MVNSSSLSSQEDLTLLPHTSLNDKADTTILLIHGALGSREDWDLVYPKLSENYHVLVPDLPGHGEARTIRPFTSLDAARRLAALVQARGRHEKAHVVGLSLGAEVAISLCTRYPEVVNTVFVSGFGVLKLSPWLAPSAPYVFWAMHHIENCLPRPAIRWAMDGTDLKHVDSTIVTVDLCRDIVTNPLVGVREGASNTDATEYLQPEASWPEPWPARTLVVAAVKRGLIPSSDSPEDASRLARIGRRANTETIAVQHPRMRHPWSRQDPLLFVNTTIAWIEHRELPDGFQLIS